ncbi:MAG: transposase, partial [Proteobacteria bacterium]|nr:transposase [Pseudomonadota bacterium]
MVEYVGFDVSKEATAFLRDGCGREGFGARAKVASAPKAPFEVLREPCLCPERIVLETGALSFWLARGLGKRGLPVDVIDARPGRTRQMKLQHNKTASGRRLELLAEIARTGFCRAVAVKSAAAQEVRILLKARCHLVRQRRDTENAIRGQRWSLGLR